MKHFLLDTGPLAAYLHNRPTVVERLTPLIKEHSVATSVLVYAKLMEYLHGFPDVAQRQATLRLVLREISPYLLTYSILERYAILRRQLRPPHGSGLIGD